MVAGSVGSPIPPQSHPKIQNKVEMTSTPKIAPMSCHDGQVLFPRVTKMSQFSVRETSRNKIP